jgi:hypothetical protein
MKRKILTAAIGAALAVNSFSVLAESTSAVGGAGASTSARLDFRLTVPKFLRLQVGTTAGTIDEIAFAPTVAQLATSPSTVVSGTGGDLGSGAVTVALQANPGADTVNLTYRTTDNAGAARAALSDGTNTVPWSTIKVATGGADAASLTHPAALADGSAADVNVVAPVPKVSGVINLSATWTYTWDDGGTIYAASAAGGYTGRVAYKLATP